MTNAFQIVDPPRIDEVGPTIVALLDVAALQTHLGGASRVVMAFTGEEAELSDSKPGRVVVMRRGGGVFGAKEHLDRVRSAHFSIRVDVLRMEGVNPSRYLGLIHAEVFKLLEGVKPVLTLSSVIHPLRLVESEGVVIENVKGSFYASRSVYKIVLGSL